MAAPAPPVPAVQVAAVADVNPTKTCDGDTASGGGAAVSAAASTTGARKNAIEIFHALFRSYGLFYELAVEILQYARVQQLFVLGGSESVDALDQTWQWRSVPEMAGFNPDLPISACAVSDHLIFVAVPIPANWASYEMRCGLFDARALTNTFTAHTTQYAPKLFACDTQPGATVVSVNEFVFMFGGGSAFALRTPSTQWSCIDTRRETTIASGIMRRARLAHSAVVQHIASASETATASAATATAGTAAGTAFAASGDHKHFAPNPAAPIVSTDAAAAAVNTAVHSPESGLRFLPNCSIQLIGGTTATEFGFSEVDAMAVSAGRGEWTTPVHEMALQIDADKLSPVQRARLRGAKSVNFCLDAEPLWSSGSNNSLALGFTGGAAVRARVKFRTEVYVWSDRVKRIAPQIKEWRIYQNRLKYSGADAALRPPPEPEVSGDEMEREFFADEQAREEWCDDAIVILGGDSCRRSNPSESKSLGMTVSSHDPSSNACSAYHPGLGVWKPLPPLSVGRAHFGCAVWTDGSIIVCGGRTGKGPTDSVERFVPELSEWQPLTPLPTSRARCTLVCVDTI